MNFFDRLMNRKKLNFVEEFINAEDKKEFLTLNQNLLKNLSKEDLKEFFLNDKIDDNSKYLILKEYSSIVKNLDNNDFYIIMPLLKSKIDICQYTDKLSTLNYNDYCKCLDNINSEECLVAVVDTTRFLQLLKEEEKLPNKVLKWYSISNDLKRLGDYYSDLDRFKDLSSELLQLLSDKNHKQTQLDIVSKSFFRCFNNNFKELDLNDITYNCAFELMNYKIKNNMELDSEILEFYAKYRIKEMNLEDFIYEVYINENNSDSFNTFGSFDYLNKVLTLNIGNIKKWYSEILKYHDYSQTEYINYINLDALFSISHEIYHARVWENQSSKTKCHLLADEYYLKSEELNLTIKNSIYKDNHDNFIDEIRADLFGMMDLSTQLNKKLTSFPKHEIKMFMKKFASEIIDMYTTSKDGSRKFISPVQKFEEFYNETLNEKNKKMTYSKKVSVYLNSVQTMIKRDKMIYSKSNSIIGKLLSGFPIPDEILMKINLVASGEIETTNIYETILKIIKDYERKLGVEERLKKSSKRR